MQSNNSDRHETDIDQRLQELLEETRDIAEQIEEEAPATSGFLDSLKEDFREAQRMWRKRE